MSDANVGEGAGPADVAQESGYASGVDRGAVQRVTAEYHALWAAGTWSPAIESAMRARLALVCGGFQYEVDDAVRAAKTTAGHL